MSSTWLVQILLTAPILVYVGYMLWASFHLIKVKPFDISSGPLSPPKLSVVVPYRNEVDSLPGLIELLQHQSFPSRFFEVLLVNDFSEDGGGQHVVELTQSLSNFYCLESDSAGKKAALTKGISRATGDFIVTIDADCLPTADWLQAISDALIAWRPTMLILPVIEQADTIGQRIRSLDFLSLSSTTAVFASRGNPLMANGANLVFSKEAFDKVGGYASHRLISSGDDVFLMQELANLPASSIRYLLDSRAVVSTPSTPSWNTFFKQRIRWGGKMTGGSSKAKGLAAIVFIACLSQLIMVALWLLSDFPIWLVATGWLAKGAVDILFIALGANKFDQQQLLIAYPLAWVVYPFTLVFTAVLSLFVKVDWKGRKIAT